MSTCNDTLRSFIAYLFALRKINYDVHIHQQLISTHLSALITLTLIPLGLKQLLSSYHLLVLYTATVAGVCRVFVKDNDIRCCRHHCVKLLCKII